MQSMNTFPTFQSMTYFRQTYGISRSITMFHRMRTWYTQKAKKAQREGDTSAAMQYNLLASVMTAYIKAAKNVW